MKKIIRSSNLSLRFYYSDGWTKEELDLLCEKGQVYCSFPEDKNPYMTLYPGSLFNCEKLLAACSKVHRMFDDKPNQTDLEFLKEHNG
jgi:hypothetical protein